MSHGWHELASDTIIITIHGPANSHQRSNTKSQQESSSTSCEKWSSKEWSAQTQIDIQTGVRWWGHTAERNLCHAFQTLPRLLHEGSFYCPEHFQPIVTGQLTHPAVYVTRSMVVKRRFLELRACQLTIVPYMGHQLHLQALPHPVYPLLSVGAVAGVVVRVQVAVFLCEPDGVVGFCLLQLLPSGL